eukprot:5150250-Alexandrium_andersonii.AAC.1
MKGARHGQADGEPAAQGPSSVGSPVVAEGTKGPKLAEARQAQVQRPLVASEAVSYTHLTLPTICSV